MKPDEHPFGSLAPRDANKRGLHRTLTLGGQYATHNHTVKHLQDLKGKTVLTETMPFTISEARAAEEAGIDTFKVKFDPGNPADAIAMRRAAPHTFMTFCIGLTKIATAEEAVRAGYIAMEAGADEIMCQWGPEFIRACSHAGIPVQAHAGLVPRLSTWTGGLRAVGKTIEEAMWIFEQIQSFEEAGAWAVEVEVVPAQLLAEISSRTPNCLFRSSSATGSQLRHIPELGGRRRAALQQRLCHIGLLERSGLLRKLKSCQLSGPDQAVPRNGDWSSYRRY